MDVRKASAVDVAGIGKAAAALAPRGVRVDVRPIRPGDVERLTAEELAMVQAAVPVRRHEFASGRVLLREMCGHDGAILRRPNRSPAFPSGFVGSLAHDRQVVVAAVARTGSVSYVGVDIESNDPLDDDIASMIRRTDETDIPAHLAFVLKEATYKAWSNSGGGFLQHHDVRLTVSNGSFRSEVIGGGAVFDGRWGEANDRCIALVAMPLQSGQVSGLRRVRASASGSVRGVPAARGR